MNHNTLAIIINYLPYQYLYDTIKVNRLWRDISLNYMTIQHQSNIILPILHNKQIKDRFIEHLNHILKLYRAKYPNNQSLQGMINFSETYPFDPTPHIFPYTNKYINVLYDYTIKHLIISDKSDTVINKLSQFEKADHYVCQTDKILTIYVYLRGSLTHVYLSDFYNYEPHHDSNKIYIWWNESYDVFNKN